MFDAYLIAVASAPTPINQCAPAMAAADPRRFIRNAGVPVVRVMSQSDYLLGIAARRPDGDVAPDLYRNYEIAGSAHATPDELNFAAASADIEKEQYAAADDDCCVVVCGGSVVGACTAYFLSRRQVEVVVVERSGVACAASGKAGGFLARDWCDGSALGPLARRLAAPCRTRRTAGRQPLGLPPSRQLERARERSRAGRPRPRRRAGLAGRARHGSRPAERARRRHRCTRRASPRR